jgi:hypothetical protein
MKTFICRLWDSSREMIGMASIFWGVFFLMMFLFCGHAKAHESGANHTHIAIAKAQTITGVAGLPAFVLPGQTFHLIKPFEHEPDVESWIEISIGDLESMVLKSKSFDIDDGESGAPVEVSVSSKVDEVSTLTITTIGNIKTIEE